MSGRSRAALTGWLVGTAIYGLVSSTWPGYDGLISAVGGCVCGGVFSGVAVGIIALAGWQARRAGVHLPVRTVRRAAVLSAASGLILLTAGASLGLALTTNGWTRVGAW